MTVDPLWRSRLGFWYQCPLWALQKHPGVKGKKHINKVLGCSLFPITEEMCSVSWLYQFQLEQKNSRFLSSCRILDEVRLSNAVRAENDLNWDSLKNNLASCGLVWNHSSRAVQYTALMGRVNPFKRAQKATLIVPPFSILPGSNVQSSLTVWTLSWGTSRPHIYWSFPLRCPVYLSTSHSVCAPVLLSFSLQLCEFLLSWFMVKELSVRSSK